MSESQMWALVAAVVLAGVQIWVVGKLLDKRD